MTLLQHADPLLTDSTIPPTTIIRTERGLSIGGTRTTLYNVLDYLAAGLPVWLIQERLNLADAQMQAALEYVAAHRSEVETEYQEIVAQAEENRRYWEARNRERFARIAANPGKPEHAALRLKLQAWKTQLQGSQS